MKNLWWLSPFWLFLKYLIVAFLVLELSNCLTRIVKALEDISKTLKKNDTNNLG